MKTNIFILFAVMICFVACASGNKETRGLVLSNLSATGDKVVVYSTDGIIFRSIEYIGTDGEKVNISMFQPDSESPSREVEINRSSRSIYIREVFNCCEDCTHEDCEATDAIKRFETENEVRLNISNKSDGVHISIDKIADKDTIRERTIKFSIPNDPERRMIEIKGPDDIRVKRIEFHDRPESIEFPKIDD
jgi:hypothetical protein